MTEELVQVAQSLLCKKQRAELYKRNLRLINSDYKGRNIYLKCPETNLDVPIPEELLKIISDMLYYHYAKMSDDLQREFDILGTDKEHKE